MAGKATCPECCSCVIATDNFNRDDSDDLGANWVEGSGDTDISSHELLFVTAPAIVIFQTDHPGGEDAPRRVKVRFKMPVGGGLLQIFPAWTDEDNRVEVQINTDVTCAEINLVKYEGAVQTYLNPDGTSTGAQIIGDGCDDEVWHTLEVCMEPGNAYYGAAGVLRVKLRLGNGKIYGSQFTGTLEGSLKVAMQGSEGVRVDNFFFEWMRDADDPQHARCPNCNTPCLVEDDDFDRADSTDLGCKWSELSGQWQIASGELTQISGGGGIALCRVFHPQIKTHHHVECEVFLEAGKTHRILVNSTATASSYHWIEASLTGTTIRIKAGIDGTTLDNQTRSGASGWYTLVACFDGHSLSGTIAPAGQTVTGTVVSASSAAISGGVYVGLAGTGGGERFDDFEFQKHYSPIDDPTDNTCPNCQQFVNDCGGCIDGEAPLFFLVRFSGVADLLATCPLNVTALVEKVQIIGLPTCNGIITVANPSDCMWAGVIEGFATVCVYITGGRLYVTVARAAFDVCSGTYIFRNDRGDGDPLFDCMNYVDFEIANMTTVPLGCCDFTLARCFLTSVP